MEKKPTAVEWIVNVVNSCIAPDYIPKEIIQQAKEMEKEQIIDAYNTSFLLRDKPYSTADKYYNETFKSE
jgi:hypothetical protein